MNDRSVAGRTARPGAATRRRWIALALASAVVACGPPARRVPPTPFLRPVYPVAVPTTVVTTPLPPDPVDHSNAARFRDAIVADPKGIEHVTSLVDDVGPRMSGSEASARAVTWGVERMKALGFTNVHTEALKESHWVRGAETAEILSPTPHTLVVTALGGSVATQPQGITAEIVDVGSIDELEKLPETDVKGKIVFFHKVMEKTREGSGYGPAVGVRVMGAIAAAKKGAVASLVRTIGTEGDRNPHTGATRYDDAVAKIPTAAVSIADAEVIHRLAQKGAVKIRLVLTPKTLPPVDGNNVVGDVPGSSKADEIVLIGAHLDSWDLGMGALDDGAGCAIVLEVGRQLALFKEKPRRTLRVVLFANEEYGIAGAKAYAKQHESEIDKHYVAIEADLGDGRAYEVKLRASAEGDKALGDYSALLFPLGVFVGDNQAEGGADVSPLRAAGVPVADVRQDATRYFDVHHSANDVLEKIVKADLDQATAAYGALAYALADREGELGRVPEDGRVSKH